MFEARISVEAKEKLPTRESGNLMQKLRLRNLDARHGRIESAAVVKNRNGIIGVDGGKGFRRPLQFPPRSPRSCAKTKTHCRHLLSQPHHEVEVCRGREVSEVKATVGPFFDNRVNII